MNGARLYNTITGKPLVADMLPPEGEGRSPAVGYRVRLERAAMLFLDTRYYSVPAGAHITLLPAPDASGIEHQPGDTVSLPGLPGRDHAVIVAVMRGFRDYHTRIWRDAAGERQMRLINRLPVGKRK